MHAEPVVLQSRALDLPLRLRLASGTVLSRSSAYATTQAFQNGKVSTVSACVAASDHDRNTTEKGDQRRGSRERRRA